MWLSIFRPKISRLMSGSLRRFGHPWGKGRLAVLRKSLSKLTPRILSVLATAYIRFVGMTSRIIWVNRVVREELEATGDGFIYTFWHGRQVFLTYLHRGNRIHPLISQSRDGELIARVCH